MSQPNVYRLSKDDILGAMWAWLWPVSSIPRERVIFADQGKPFPETPCATIKIISRQRVGFSDEKRQEGGSFYLSGLRDFSLSVNLYGPDAMQMAYDACDSLDTTAVGEAFAALGISLVDYDNVRNLTHLLETEREERAQMDLLIEVASNVIDPGIVPIETVNVTNSNPTP